MESKSTARHDLLRKGSCWLAKRSSGAGLLVEPASVRCSRGSMAGTGRRPPVRAWKKPRSSARICSIRKAPASDHWHRMEIDPGRPCFFPEPAFCTRCHSQRPQSETRRQPWSEFFTQHPLHFVEKVVDQRLTSLDSCAGSGARIRREPEQTDRGPHRDRKSQGLGLKLTVSPRRIVVVLNPMKRFLFDRRRLVTSVAT